jgi:hypothetical protein
MIVRQTDHIRDRDIIAHLDAGTLATRRIELAGTISGREMAD